MMNTVNLLHATRPMMLLVSLSSFFLALVTLDSSLWLNWNVLLLIVGILAAHAGFNLLCSARDVASGYSHLAKPMPLFSSIQGDEDEAKLLHRAGFTMLVLALLIGIFFTLRVGSVLMLPIVFTLVMIFLYPGWLLKSPHINLVMPGILLGPVLILSANYALGGEYNFTALYVSLAAFFLISNLYLLQQYTNWQLNREQQRFYFPVVYGTKRSSVVYVVFIMGAMYVIGMGDVIGVLVESASWAMLPLLLSIYAVVGGFKFGSKEAFLSPYLWCNWLATVMTPMLLVVLMAC